MPCEIIVKSFKICGISNNLDGTEDNLIWEEGTGEGEEPAIVLPEDVLRTTNKIGDTK